MSETVFERLNKINVNDKTEKKGRFTYLSWAFAWAEIKKLYPDAQTTVYHDEVTNKPYFGAGDAGVLVKVGVTIQGVEHINYLPCMDFKNAAIPESKVNMMDVNKAIQRATVKAISLHGLGLYIYAGEDLPEGEEEASPVKKKKSATSKTSSGDQANATKETKKRTGNNFKYSNKKNEETATKSAEPEL